MDDTIFRPLECLVLDLLHHRKHVLYNVKSAAVTITGGTGLGVRASAAP